MTTCTACVSNNLMQMLSCGLPLLLVATSTPALWLVTFTGVYKRSVAWSCPVPMASLVQVDAGAADKDAVEVPEWAMQLRPELAAVMRSLQRLSGAALARPDMKPFRQLLGSFSPEALLAVGDSLFSHRALLETHSASPNMLPQLKDILSCSSAAIRKLNAGCFCTGLLTDETMSAELSHPSDSAAMLQTHRSPDY